MPDAERKDKLLTLLTETDRLLRDQIDSQKQITSEKDAIYFFEHSIPLLWEHRIHMENVVWKAK